MPTPARALCVVACAALAACARTAIAPAALPAPLGAPDVRLMLIGDAGGAVPNPVLRALQQALGGASANVALFLGDNIYPDGMPEPAHADRPRAEGRMQAQVDAVLGTGNASGIVVAGNHDWGKSDTDGPTVLAREVEFVNRAGVGRVVMRPAAGCPGPDVIDLGSSVRLVLLDTEWWLRSTVGAQGGCLTSQKAVLDSMTSAIAGGGERRVIVAAHHPLVSVGAHGGRFGWQQHLFPLTEWWRPLWLPLPIVGSAYALYARARPGREDLRSAPYGALRGAMDSVISRGRVFAWVAGHEHNLQVDRTPRGVLHLVSGSGSRERPGYVVPSSSTRFAAQANGFMQLDVWADGRVWLTVVAVDAQGRTTPRLMMEVPE